MSTRTVSSHDLVVGLRRWTRSHDAHVRAAVELLIEHDHWLRDPVFLHQAVQVDQTNAWIRWTDAAEVLERSKCSSTEHAILELAIALAANRYRLASMGPSNSAAIARAVATAAGVPA